MNGYKRILLLVLIMTAVAATAAGAALTILYNTAFDVDQARLTEIAKRQASLIETEIRQEQEETESRGIALSRALVEIRGIFSNYQSFNETGEFTLARREGDKIVFLLRHRRHRFDGPLPVPFSSPLAEPMRRALSGRSGTVVGLDYRRVMVLAAFEPLAVLDLGIVAKIDLSEIRAPFIRAGAIVVVITILFVLSGTVLFFYVTNPLIRRVQESEERLSGAIESLQEGFVLFDKDDHIVMINDVYRQINPKADEFLEQNMRFEDIHRVGVERGQIPEAIGREEAFIRERLKQHRNPKGPILRQTLDGLWYVIKETRTPEGGTAVTFTDITDLKKAEAAIEESEKRFRDLVEGSVQGVLIHAGGRTLFANQAYADIFGYDSPKELLAQDSVLDHVAPHDRKRMKAYTKARLHGKEAPVTYEFQGIGKDGSPILIENRTRVVTWKGQLAVQRTIIDITERKQAEEALENSEARLRRSVLDAPIPIIMHAEDGEILMLSNRWTELSGYSHSDIPTILDWTEKAFGTDKKQMKRMRKVINALYDNKDSSQHEAYITTASGEQRTWEVRNAPLGRLTDGRRFVISMAVDITERKKAEGALRRSEERLSGAIESLREAFVLFDVDDRIVMANDVYRQLNPQADEFLEKRIRFEDLLRANVERGQIPKAIGREEAFIRERLEQHRNPGAPIMRQIDDGSWLLIKETRTPEGGIAVTFTDITDLKKAEEALRHSEDRLSGAVMSLQEGFVLFDADDRLIMMNDVYRRMEPAAEEFLELGMSFEDSIRAYVERGLIVEALGREEAFIRERMEKHRNPKGPIIRQFTNGSWYIIEETRTPEGGAAMTFTDITGLKQFETALKESQQRFKDIAESTSDWIWEIGPDLRFTYFSDRYQEITHFDPKDRLGTRRQDFLPPGELEAHPEKWAAHLADLEARRPFKDFEYASTATAEGIRYIRISGKPVFDFEGHFLGYRGTGTDITEPKKAQEALRKLSQAVEQSPASVIITDTDGTIEYVNKKFIEITGYSAEEAIGQNPRLLKSVKTSDAVYERLWAAVTAGKEWRGTLHNKRKDGTVYLAGVSISPIMAADGAVTHFIAAQQDITQRVEDERQLKHVEKMESLGGLAGGIAHDFNNMLLPILSLTDMTRKSLPEDSRNRLRLEKVVEAATRAKDLVARILAFSRQEDAKQENIDIHAAIHETMDLLRSTLPTTIKIKQRLKRDTGTVFADRAQMASVLLNLASNAADAMDGKTGEMTVSLSPAMVGKKKAASIPGLHEGKYAKLAVKDNGHGMDEETLARILEPFFTTKPVGEGTGLGLSMVHGIVSKHAGAVHIKTAPGKGTTVDVYLPLVDGEAGHESRDGNDLSGDVRNSAGSSRQPEADMEKQA